MNETNEFQNADSAPYWEAAKEGRLLLQKCESCSNVQFPPRRNCGACWHEKLTWIESAGKGTVESMTVVRRAPTPDMRDRVPYAVVAVKLEEGPRMITNLIGDGALAVSVGDAVTVAFEPDMRGNVLPQFRLV